MTNVRDFRIVNYGSDVILLLLDAEGREVFRMTMSWITGVRLLNEAAMAVGLGLKTQPRTRT